MNTVRISRRLSLYLQCAAFLLAAMLLFWFMYEPDASVFEPVKDSSVQTKAKGDLHQYIPEKAFTGVTLISSVGTAEVLLVNMQGSVIHSWPVDAERARLLENGNLLTITGSKWGHDRSPWKELRPVVREYTWNGDIAWEYRADDVLHHDVHRLKNSNTLLLKRSFVPAQIQADAVDPDRRLKPIRADSVLEVSPSGEIVHEWNTYDHLDINYCGVRACSEVEHNESHEFLDWTHTNTVGVLPENQWYSAGDNRFKPGNLILMPRNWWHIIIVDRETGKEVWRYRGDYRGGMSGGHDPQMISPGLPGAGNILVLDNGTATHRGESIVLEINPQSKAVGWKYENGREFFTKSRGSVQRLPNGNTLIAEDRTGRIFEVDPDGTIVWEFDLDHATNRAERYPASYCPACPG